MYQCIQTLILRCFLDFVWIPGIVRKIWRSIDGVVWLVKNVPWALWLAGVEVWPPQTCVTWSCQNVLCTDHRVQHWRREKTSLTLLLSSANLERSETYIIWRVFYFVGCQSFCLISNLKSVNITEAQTHVASISTSQTDTGDIWFWICWGENVQILFPSQVTDRLASNYICVTTFMWHTFYSCLVSWST